MKQRTLFDLFLAKPVANVDATSQPCEPSLLMDIPLSTPDTLSNQKEATVPQAIDINMIVDEPLVDLAENRAFPFLSLIVGSPTFEY